mmetsp:Transcript_95753/g.270997  ORF Transcript_95753/g.270997 Transcript_95753/m.270997 type:complete len:93 (+) Transcript_95753:64-342(+)
MPSPPDVEQRKRKEKAKRRQPTGASYPPRRPTKHFNVRSALTITVAKQSGPSAEETAAKQSEPRAGSRAFSTLASRRATGGPSRLESWRSRP